MHLILTVVSQSNGENLGGFHIVSIELSYLGSSYTGSLDLSSATCIIFTSGTLTVVGEQKKAIANICKKNL